MALFRLIYCSRNLISGTNEQILDEIDRLLDTASRNNAESRISGALLFNRNRFAQVLEGPRAAVEIAFDRIKDDIRHDEIVVLQAEQVDKRAFEGWGIAFVGAETSIDTIHRTITLKHVYEGEEDEGPGILSFLMVLVRREVDADLDVVLV